MIEINAQGLSCPEPLLMVIEAIKKHPDEEIVVEVDAVPPSENIARFAKKEGYSVRIENKPGGIISLTLRKE